MMGWLTETSGLKNLGRRYSVGQTMDQVDIAVILIFRSSD
jgi:hypothetical protein